MDEIFTHPVSGATIFGRRVQPGEALEATDVYDSTVGHWEPCAFPGLVLADGATATWVRPARCGSCGGDGCGACEGSGRERLRDKVPA